MEIKNYKRVTNLLAFLIGLLIAKDIHDYPYYFTEGYGDSIPNHIIPQTIYVIDLIILIVFYIVITKNIKKKGVFNRRNELTFFYFGLVILFLALSSDILFNWLTGERPSGARILAILGGTLVFVSLIFKIGIKMQEEQDLIV